MDEKQGKKLERYLKNSSKFLWGIAPHRKPYKQNESYQWNVYRWLHNRGFPKRGEPYSGRYDSVTNQLLEDYGIEKVLKGLVIPRVHECNNAALDYLRNCWNTGNRPDPQVIQAYKISDQSLVSVFVEIRSADKVKWVERWTTFSGIFFEELEGLQETGKMKEDRPTQTEGGDFGE